MTAEDAFLKSIKETPGDDGLRLIFADWLEDQGQHQRAEFLRLQVELSQLNEGHPRRAELEQRAAALPAASHLARLTELNLASNDIGAKGGAALAASSHLARLSSLDLASNRIGEEAAAQLRERYGSACRL